ncbi:hypothetical protein ACH5BK_12835 [Arcobacter sp. YIC-80]|uniref:hypothetical protein n=2 Tax=unclassified Arcobacter TaxID=2593671 RepID=UPI00384CCCCD
MPTSFEFVIPDNFLFIPANLSFISFCIFFSFILFRIFKSKIIFMISLVLTLSIFYNDLLLKYAIKSFYSITSYNSTFNKQAQKNQYGRIESLSTIKVYGYDINQLANLSSSNKQKIIAFHEEHIEKFLEIPSIEYKFKRYKYKKIRLPLNSYEYYEDFDNIKKARYSINVEKINSFFPEIYDEYKYRFIDNKSNEVLATAYYLKFIERKSLRHKFLYWDESRDKSFSPNDIENFDEIYKKVFL